MTARRCQSAEQQRLPACGLPPVGRRLRCRPALTTRRYRPPRPTQCPLQLNSLSSRSSTTAGPMRRAWLCAAALCLALAAGVAGQGEYTAVAGAVGGPCTEPGATPAHPSLPCNPSARSGAGGSTAGAANSGVHASLGRLDRRLQPSSAESGSSRRRLHTWLLRDALCRRGQQQAAPAAPAVTAFDGASAPAPPALPAPVDAPRLAAAVWRPVDAAGPGVVWSSAQSPPRAACPPKQPHAHPNAPTCTPRART